VAIGVGMGAGLYDAAFATLGVIFGDKARGAITNLTLIAGFSSTLCWPLSAWLVEVGGWRGTCLIYAAIQLAVCLPLHLIALPRAAGKGSSATPERTYSLSARERRLFVTIALVTILCGTTAAIVSIHLFALLETRGVGAEAAIAVGALIGPAQVGARLVEMAGGGRHHSIWTMVASIGLIALGIGLLWLGLPIVALCIVLYGGGMGIFSIARGTLPLAVFGVERYAVVMGQLALPGLVAQAAAPVLGAVMIAQINAESALALLAGLCFLNLGFVALLWAQVARHPQHSGSVTEPLWKSDRRAPRWRTTCATRQEKSTTCCFSVRAIRRARSSAKRSPIATWRRASRAIAPAAFPRARSIQTPSRS